MPFQSSGPSVPPAAVLIVNNDGRLELFSAFPADAQRVRDCLGAPSWEADGADPEEAARMKRMLQSVIDFRTTHRVRVRVSGQP